MTMVHQCSCNLFVPLQIKPNECAGKIGRKVIGRERSCASKIGRKVISRERRSLSIAGEKTLYTGQQMEGGRRGGSLEEKGLKVMGGTSDW